MYDCVCLWFWLLVGRQVAAEVIPNSPLNGLLNCSASPPRAAQHKLTPPQWNPVYALNWPLSHSSRDTTVEFLALHSHFCTALTHVLPMWLSVCMWVCMRWQQRMFGKCHFLPQSDSTGGGSSPFPDSNCAPRPLVLVSFQMFHWFHLDLKNDKQIALDREKLFPPKNGHNQQDFLGGPNSL